MADWRSVAAQQKQQLESKNATIDHLNQQVRTAERQVADLQFQLAEAGEALTTARTKTNTTANELLSKAQLKYDDLAAKYGQVLNRARLAEDDLEAAIVLYHQKDAELRTRAHPGAGNKELERMLAVSRAENEKLTTELAAAKRETACLRFQNPEYDVDQDDEELRPEQCKTYTSVAGQPTALSASLVSRRMPPAYKQTSSTSCTVAAPSLLTSIPVRAKATAPATPRKRKRAVESDIEESEDEGVEEEAEETNYDEDDDLDNIDEDELRDLRQQASPPPTPKRRRVVKDLRDSDDDIVDFTFDAIISWHADGRPEDNLSDDDLKDVAEELWEGIEVVRDKWQLECGEYWYITAYSQSITTLASIYARQYDLEKPGRKATDRAQCVTKKLCGGKETSDGVELLGGPTLWRKGVEGKAACRDCVANGWPCFTWYRANDEEDGRLLLLPLHDLDRKQKVQEGFEIRHWLNA
ncbi:hypothetical protein LTR27_011373 [Elasticomyces elasticus]|nr:hypothetical protein LTR27_011373 [Elasticomyces elasticus]